MYDVKTLKASPGLARRLIQFSQLNNMAFDEDLVELALQDLVTQAELEKSGCLLNNSEIAVLQHIKDWQGRAMVLTPNHDVGRKVAMAHLATSDGRSLILADPKNYAEWVHRIREIMPDKKICVFGNPRYKDKNWPLDIEFEEKPDPAADIFVTSYGGLIWNNLLTSVVISQTIVEELDHPTAVNYKWQDSVKGIFHEVPAPLFLQNIHSLPRDPGYDIYTSLQIAGSKAISFVVELSIDYMWSRLGHGLIGNIMGHGRREANGYLNARGYRGDFQKLLALVGISTDLISGSSQNKPMVFRDLTVNQVKGARNKRSDSGLHRIYLREGEMEAHTGRSIPELVQSALDGDMPSQSIVGALQNSQWANLKSTYLKSIHLHFAHRGTRTLFLADNKDIIRALNLQFGAGMWSFDDNPMVNAARFTNGIIPDYVRQLIVYDQFTIKPMNNMIISPSMLMINPLLLKAADYVVQTQWVQSQTALDDIADMVKQAGAKLVLPVTMDTFEEHFFELSSRKTS